MPKLSTKMPKFCRHARGQAFVKIAGQQIWLGRYGEPATREKYDRLVAQWLANGRTLPAAAPPPAAAEPLSIHGVLAPYWRWAKERYTPAEVDTLRAALRVVEQLYGTTPAVAFGPNALRTVRSEMVRKGWTRKQINRQVAACEGCSAGPPPTRCSPRASTTSSAPSSRSAAARPPSSQGSSPCPAA